MVYFAMALHVGGLKSFTGIFRNRVRKNPDQMALVIDPPAGQVSRVNISRTSIASNRLSSRFFIDAAFEKPGNMPFHWNISPIIFQVGPLAVRWYGIFFAASFLAGYKIMQWIYRREKRPEIELETLFAYMFFGVFLGARLGHCLFYDPGFYLGHPIEILKIWEGGLASHGAALGILTSLLVFTRRAGRPSYLWLLDRIVLPVALAGFFIRMGNFFNSEIVGISSNRSWAVVFESVDSVPRHAVQLYEAFAYGSIFVLLIWVYRSKGTAGRQGMLLGGFLVSVFSVRFFLEFMKTRQAAYEASQALSVGQWLSIPFIAIGLMLLVRSLKSFHRHAVR
jgi:phosphatidylglycerol---prolipoprotein diacylglyceryl transferase